MAETVWFALEEPNKKMNFWLPRKTKRRWPIWPINAHGAEFEGTMHFRLMQMSSRHAEILEKLDHTDELTAVERECLEFIDDEENDGQHRTM